MTKLITDSLVRQLSAPRWKFWITGNKRAKAALELAGIGSPAVTDLACSLAGPGAAYAVLALKKIGPKALKPLIEALEDKDENIRMWSALTLGEMGRWAEQIVPILQRKAEQDKSEDVRESVKIALEKIRN